MAILLVGLGAFGPRVVHAQEAATGALAPLSARARARLARGAEAFRAGEPARAAAIFAEAYADEPNPILLYNWGLALAESRRCDEALPKLSEVADDPRVPSEVRGAAKTRAEHCRAEVGADDRGGAHSRGADSRDADDRGGETRDGDVFAAGTPPRTGGAREPRDGGVADGGDGAGSRPAAPERRLWPWAFAGGALLLAGATATTWVLADRAYGDADASLNYASFVGHVEKGDRWRRWAYVGLGGTLACTAAAAIGFALAPRGGGESPARVVVLPAAGGGFVVATARSW